MYAMWSRARSFSIASAPTRELGISDRPDPRSSVSISSAARSAASSGTGRRVSALATPDDGGFVEVAGIDDARVTGAAVRTAHRPSIARPTTTGSGPARGYNYIG